MKTWKAFGPTIMLRIDALYTQPNLRALAKGMYLVDCNEDLWTLIDTDGTHNIYARHVVVSQKKHAIH